MTYARLFFLTALLLPIYMPAQTFYNKNTIQTIEIFFAQG
ncbi:MAG: hypothetical protein RIQ90_1428, partial [Bacteroidota bacterium]